MKAIKYSNKILLGGDIETSLKHRRKEIENVRNLLLDEANSINVKNRFIL